MYAATNNIGIAITMSEYFLSISLLDMSDSIKSMIPDLTAILVP